MLSFYICIFHKHIELLTIRLKRAGNQLGFAGALVEVRGDWLFFNECFGFPHWRSLNGICWRCRCTPDQVRQVGSDASWRRERLSHMDMMQRILEEGSQPSPLFRAPYVTTSIFKMDWLHAADHGVTADFLGNLFWMVLPKMGGRSRKIQCQRLWDHCLLRAQCAKHKHARRPAASHE